MRFPNHCLLVLLVLGAVGAPSQAQGPDTGGRRSLRQEFAEFLSLPTDQQERLRGLDRQLHSEDLDAQDRLIKVMQKYVDWLERLPPELRARVVSASSTEEKLRRIRAIRLEQWIASLPERQRERIAAATSFDERAQIIAEISAETRRREQELNVRSFGRFNRPSASPSDLSEWRAPVMNRADSGERRRLGQIRPRSALILYLFDLSIKYEAPVPGSILPDPPRFRFTRYLRTLARAPEGQALAKRLMDNDSREAAREELIIRYWRDHRDELEERLEEEERRPPRERQKGREKS